MAARAYLIFMSILSHIAAIVNSFFAMLINSKSEHTKIVYNMITSHYKAAHGVLIISPYDFMDKITSDCRALQSLCVKFLTIYPKRKDGQAALSMLVYL